MGHKYGPKWGIGGGGGYNARTSSSNLDPTSAEEKDKETDKKLESYASDLEVRDKKIHEINESRRAIEGALSEKLEISEKHIIGSYARNTMIEHEDGNDVDVMVVLDARRHGDWRDQPNGPANCLQAVKRIIESDPRFKNSEVHIDKNAVTVKCGDFSIDVVPAFRHPDGGYVIPDTHGETSWTRTNPRMFKRIMSVADRENDGKVSKVVKIVKGWNEANEKPLNSFHIENMVYQYFDAQKGNTTSVTDNIEGFFYNLPWYIRGKCQEPVYQGRVDGYLTPEERSTAIEKARDAVKKLETANKLRENGKDDTEEYKKVFGESFAG